MKKSTILILFIAIIFNSCKSLKTVSTKKPSATEQLALTFLNKESVPGMSISVSKNGNTIFSKGFGYSNLEDKVKVSPNKTQFRIASISKPLTAAALAKLVDDNKLNFDNSIYEYLPGFSKKKFDFTIRQVGGHIAGIRHYKGKEFLLNTKMSIVEGLEIFKNDQLLHKPGSQYSYSTYGWNLLSAVIQNAAKTDFNQYMQSTIFKPLKMDNTTLDVSDSIMPNRTQFYRKTKAGKIILGPQVSNEHKVAGGGFLSTSEDLLLFGNEILSPKILSKMSIAQLVKTQYTTSGKKTNYGIGFSVGKTKNGTPKYSHSGGGIGASTLLLIYPEEKIVISILTNRSQVPIFDIGNALEAQFLN